MKPFASIDAQPIFFDASGRRASRLRRATQILGVLVLLYVGLLAASLLRVPGAGRVSLPTVGRLFPEAAPSAPPSVENAPNMNVVAERPRPATPRSTTVTTAARTSATTVAVTPSPAPRRASNSGNTTPPTAGNTGATTASTAAVPGQGPDGEGPPGQQRKSTTEDPRGGAGNGRGGGSTR